MLFYVVEESSPYGKRSKIFLPFLSAHPFCDSCDFQIERNQCPFIMDSLPLSLACVSVSEHMSAVLYRSINGFLISIIYW